MKLPPMLSIGEIIKLYGLSAKQTLSQNFLLNLNITDKVAGGAGSLEGCTIIEVGPGPGPLTRSLLKRNCKNLIVVEKDKRFLPPLTELQRASESRMQVVIGDCLTVDERELVKPYEPKPNTVKIFGNLPFGVATPLLLKWIRQIGLSEGCFAYGKVSMVLMFQKEVADRILAQPQTEYYSRLSVLVQRVCRVKRIFNIPGSCFVPPPNVAATAVLMETLDQPIGPPVNVDSVEYLTLKLFGQKRKTLYNCVKQLGIEYIDLLYDAGIDGNRRAEELSIVEWCNVIKCYENIKAKISVDSSTVILDKIKKL